MNIGAASERVPGERRVGLMPQAIEKLTRLGASLHVESGYGAPVDLDDEAYRSAGATLHPDRRALLAVADCLVTVAVPGVELVSELRPGVCLVGFMDPFRNLDLVRALAERNVEGLCMELIPRSTYAQKMDALSSQASLAGYAAVIKAADRINKSLPMMTTPAGTIPPARVFVIGVGVAGLQAIATAKRLGARVEAYDTRPVVEEQVQSLGAKFVKIDVGETGQTDQGYAKELTTDQLDEQRRQMARHVAGADIVITTAQLFGRPAPRIVSADMVRGMRRGSVAVDLAASTGGNIEGSVVDQEVEVDGVRIIGLGNLPAEVARDASQMYANNVANLLEHAWDKETSALRLDPEDPVLASCLLIHDGAVRDERIRTLLEGNA
jgi:NAD(P) transhydrogenase subunit alpha